MKSIILFISFLGVLVFGEKEGDRIKFISFVRRNRSYVINFSYSRDLVKDYIESREGKDPTAAKRWELLYWLLSNKVMPADLLTLNK
jgi:hypothetical protein